MHCKKVDLSAQEKESLIAAFANLKDVMDIHSIQDHLFETVVGLALSTAKEHNTDLYAEQIDALRTVYHFFKSVKSDS